MKNPIVLTLIVALLVGAAAFFGGMKYQQAKATDQFRGGPGNFRGQDGNHAGEFQGRGGSGRPIAGEIINQDDKSITVKLQDGSSKLVIVSDSTQINRAQKAEKGDLKNGERVAVFGAENSDGSVTAQNIQLDPQFRGEFGDHSPSPSPAQ